MVLLDLQTSTDTSDKLPISFSWSINIDVVKPKTNYHVKATNDRVFAKTAAVLKRIQDHYNGSVDDPIVVLDQETSSHLRVAT